MKKKLIIFFSIVVQICFGQTDSMSLYLNAQKQNEMQMTLQNLDKNLFDYNISTKIIQYQPFDSQFNQSLFKSNSYSVSKISDYNYTIRHFNNLSLFTFSSNNNYLFEGANSINFGFTWNISDKLIFSENSFLTSYFFGPMDYNRRTSIGATTTLTYIANDWLTFHLFGTFAYNGLNSSYSTTFLAPQNSFGGEMIVKFSNAFRFGGGVKYINYNGKWTPQFYTLPLLEYRLKKIKK